jgi:Protein of unknown function (Hypoth_ymh)
MDFGAGCFEAIRNPAAHEHGLNLPEQVALEQLAAFSLLARWIEECEVDMADGASTAGQTHTQYVHRGQDDTRTRPGLQAGSSPYGL